MKQMTVLPWQMVNGSLVPIAGGKVLIFATGVIVNLEEFE
jgi:hypothetical protein